MKTTASPFHAGEREVQERLGVRGKIEVFARRVARNYLPDQHREFYEMLVPTENLNQVNSLVYGDRSHFADT